MVPNVPGAVRIDRQRLLSVSAIPLAAALAMATAVLASDGDVTVLTATTGGAVAIILSFMKVCYLAVGAAHLSGAITERTMGIAPPLWLDGATDGREGFWQAFPNHLDGAAIALAIAVVCVVIDQIAF
jgi:hypothetical protein